MKLSDLTQRREEHIQSCLHNNDKSHEIIAGLYSDPSHFIYEILQNADDAGASKVKFELISDSLSITHNGKKLFDFKDVDSITTVGSSTKKDDVNSIGTFGAGFKSVFAITKTPHIHSGEYHFKITDFIVPEEITSLNIKPNTTVIILPFDHACNAYNQISKHLKTLESESLLFLRNIKEIQWETESDRGHYLSEVNGNKASLISQVNEEDSLREYFLCTKNIEIANTQLNIVVAYRLDKDGAVDSVHDSKLFVFFPTIERTGFNFLAHAPYKTTPSRESIPFGDDQNQLITKELSCLVAESIIELKNSGLLNVNALSILPIDPENKHPLYEAAFHQVKSIFSSNSLLPTVNGGYENSNSAILAREKELTNLLKVADCSKLFNRNTWLSTDITYDKTGPLQDYLTEELLIPEITMQKFCSKITEDFIVGKTDNWIIDFYSSITNNNALYRQGSGYHKGILRNKPIIRLEDGSHINPENDSGDIQVYLPTAGESQFNTVKRILAKNEESLEFLKNLGLEKPDDIAEVKEFIIPKYQDTVIDKEEYIEDVKLVMKIWTDSNEYQKKEICDLLNACWFVRCKNQIGDISFQKLEETYVYFNSDLLSRWFSGGTDETIYFINIGLEITTEIKEFFKCLDVDEKLKIIEEEDDVLKKDVRRIQRIDGFNPNVKINGLEYSLENINKDRSTFLWQFLLTNNPNRLSGRTKERKYLYEEFKIREIENTEILVSLKDNFWLYNKESVLIKKPLSEILLNDLNDDYNKDHDDIEKLVKALGLKLDKVAEFEKETGLRAVNKEEYDKFTKWEEQTKDYDESLSETSWKPEISAADATPIEGEVDLEKHESDDLSGQSATEDSTKSSKECNEQNNDYSNSTSPQNSKAIGDWGEEVAEKYLNDKYPENEVVWLNRNGGIGKGYDFVIRSNGKDIAYYEIKSKTDESPKLFQVSGTQWNWAKKLHDSKKGDMYKILVISNAGTQQPKIREINNPVGLWKSGELYADPVYIEL